MTISVSFGVNDLNIDANGKTVQQVRSQLREALSMSGAEDARVNNDVADDTQVLNDGDELEFVKAAGKKG